MGGPTQEKSSRFSNAIKRSRAGLAVTDYQSGTYEVRHEIPGQPRSFKGETQQDGLVRAARRSIIEGGFPTQHRAAVRSSGGDAWKYCPTDERQ